MSEDDKARRQLALHSPRYASYDVGYARPPAEHRFRKGQSGNPRGRPRGSKNKLPPLNEERLKTIVLEEAYRTITVRDGNKNITVPIAKAVVRSLAVSAAKGNNRAAQLFTQMIKLTERENHELAFGYFRSAINYKDSWNAELSRRRSLGITGPEPLPHPDDLILDARAGTVTVRGPMVESEKDWWLAADIIKTEARKTIAKNERLLKRNPDHPDRSALLQAVETKNRDLDTLNEYYTDDVIERVVRSRTQPDGSVEFCRCGYVHEEFRKVLETMNPLATPASIGLVSAGAFVGVIASRAQRRHLTDDAKAVIAWLHRRTQIRRPISEQI